MSHFIQVINLDTATERLAQFDQQVSKFGFEYARLDAIKGSDLSVLDVTRNTMRSIGCRPLYPNEIALGLSHRACWLRFLETDFETTIIFEDDVIFGNSFNEILADDWVPQDADIIKLETMPTQFTCVGKLSKGAVGSREIVPLWLDHVGSAAYLVTRRGARRLIAEIPEITSPIDVHIFSCDSLLFHKLNLYQVVPAPCIQAIYTSANEGWAQTSVRVASDADGETSESLLSKAPTSKLAIFYRTHIRHRILWRFAKLLNRVRGGGVKGAIPFG